jgi:hypothetical protein
MFFKNDKEISKREIELIRAYKKLPKELQEYYYHQIKADAIKEEILKKNLFSKNLIL